MRVELIGGPFDGDSVDLTGGQTERPENIRAAPIYGVFESNPYQYDDTHVVFDANHRFFLSAPPDCAELPTWQRRCYRYRPEVGPSGRCDHYVFDLVLEGSP